MKRRSLRPISAHRKKIDAERARLQEAAWGPRPWRCQMTRHVLQLLFERGEGIDAGQCFGPVNGHEILSRAQSGQSDENLLDVDNQVPLCNFHNGWVDTHRDEAERLGLRRSWMST